LGQSPIVAAHSAGAVAGRVGLRGCRPGRLPALARRALVSGAGVLSLFLLGTQRGPLPDGIRSSAARLVLPAGAVGGFVAGHPAAAAVPTILMLRRSRRRVPPRAGIGVHAAGGRLVRALLFFVGLQVADLRSAGVSAARIGAWALYSP